MPVKPDREYRSIPMLKEKRAEGEDRKYMVEGYACTFDEYELFREGDTPYCERIDPAAFDGCDMTDVIFNIDHSGRVYARTRNGSVDLRPDFNGLYCKIDLSRSTSARETLEDIECGNYDRMSFAFTVKEDSVEHDREANKYLRVIKRFAKIFDISAVSFPANPNTEIGVASRSAFDGLIEREAQEMREAEALELRKRKLRIQFEMENEA